ncbi:MAG TPA: VOC family protein [Gemmatimonadales bacterium]|nr:VOC family protein [Gemmatimonadales bacterium]
MPKTVPPIPTGSLQITPYLTVRNGKEAIAFYQKAFGAREIMRMDDPSGRIGHAELAIGTGRIMLADEYPEMGNRSPETVGGTPVMIHFYTEDVDSVAKAAVAAGGVLDRPVEDQFYGDRSGQLRDPFGHIWWISTHIEDVAPEEMKRRAEAKFGAGHAVS